MLRRICGGRILTSAREGEGGLERGATLAFVAIILPLVLAFGALVVDIGNWWVHARHLQTKVDAAAFAGGGVWGFPCGPDVDASIEAEARQYVGPHTTAAGTVLTSGFNPQVGATKADRIHVVLNGGDWWDDDAGASPADRTDPLNPSICEAKVLDVKATEANADLLFGWMPIFPDIKRKARVEIQETEGLSGLLPIAVRLPQPLSTAAIFYDEDPAANGQILATRYFREVCTPSVPTCIFGAPPGLGQWTTLDDLDPSSWASFAPAATTGVVIATSFRPACGTPGAQPPCFDIDTATYPTVNQLCNQGTSTQIVQCYDATGSWPSQAVQSGLHFLRGYPPGDAGTGPPQLRSAYLENVSCASNGYFNSGPGTSCQVRLHVAVDLGSVIENPPPDPPDTTEETRKALNVQVRYRLARADGTSFCDYGATCDLEASSSGGSEVTFSTSGTVSSPHLPITGNSRGNAIAIEIMVKGSSVTPNPGNCGVNLDNFNANCRWFYTGNGIFGTSVPPTDAQILAAPVQRSFMGNLDRTGAVKWLRLGADAECDALPPLFLDLEAASQPTGANRCFFVDMGLQGGIARDQDEPPIALNLGTGSSQRALVDCDPDVQPDPKEEIVLGCSPLYAANKFNTVPLCPGTAGFFSVPKPSPFDSWPPYRCVLTQTTAAANQLIQGFNDRIFADPGNPQCPSDDATQYVKGRNYWHRDNNGYDDATFAWDGDTPNDKSDDWGNELRDGDRRLVTLFFTAYSSFTSPGNETFPIVGFGNFYVTGYGRTQNGGWQGGAPDDPCDFGNDGDLFNGNGNEPPPDLDFSSNTTWVWGHFVKDVTPGPFTSGGSGVLCEPQASFMPCVAVLVE